MCIRDSYVPDENPVGCYRKHFILPQAWAGPVSYTHLPHTQGGLSQVLSGLRFGFAATGLVG